MNKHYRSINKFIEGNKNIIVDVEQNILNHFNRVHCGSLILSMSKRIMNEVMCLADDNNINIYYQDTDSMHITKSQVEKLG